jgi:cell division protein FtsW
VAGLILLQPNLSSAALLGLTGMLMLFLGGARIRHLLIPVAGGAAAAALALATHPYMMKRVETYVGFLFGGQLDARGPGWQLDQSLIAIGSGGWFGRGIGAGLQKYLFLPEAHTDFIYSILAEETGFIGSTVLILLLAALAWRGLRATMRAEDRFAYLLAGGLTVQLALYAIANLSVATGLAPTTGLPLPYVSYGGSALIANMAAAGLLHRVSAGNATREALTRQRWAREVTA